MVVNWGMLKTFLLPVILTLCRFPQDVRVVTYSNGRTSSKDYESLAFWIKSNQRAYVRYAHGTDDEIDIGWGGPDSSGGKKGFRLRGPADTLNWVLIAQGNAIRLTDRRGRQKNYAGRTKAAHPPTAFVISAPKTKARQWPGFRNISFGSLFFSVVIRLLS
ncbi:hypothetical protein ACQ86N_13845 [Puia sp. P3]|uniref:hypothetical protein n=1 Tax=Puia sp. P3 TaxID=3423952 RepID=UPI003D665F25